MDYMVRVENKNINNDNKKKVNSTDYYVNTKRVQFFAYKMTEELKFNA
jgi:hypothetical protein